MGRKEERKEKEVVDRYLPSHCLLQVTRSLHGYGNATPLTGLRLSPTSFEDQNPKDRKEQTQMLQFRKSLKQKKTLYAQVHRYLHISKKDYRSTIRCMYASSAMNIQHSLGSCCSLLEFFDNSGLVPIVTRAGKAETLTSRMKLRILLQRRYFNQKIKTSGVQPDLYLSPPARGSLYR